MTLEHATHLQRIGAGLPVIARVENGTLHLSPENDSQRTWAEFPIELEQADAGAERYDATLEVFCRGERLDSKAILERGIKQILEDSKSTARLVLDHREDGNPCAKPEWKAKGIVVVARPTLARSEGKASWTLARSLPCSEIRAYRKEADGSWTVEREIRNSSETAIEGKRGNEPKPDRYAAMCRNLPVRPLAKPFAIRSIGRSEKDGSMNSYRL